MYVMCCERRKKERKEKTKKEREKKGEREREREPAVRRGLIFIFKITFF